MTLDEFSWTVVRPIKWPELPSRLSYSTFHEIERCPRQWGLSRADYAFGKGYPRRYSTPAIAGQIVHASLDRILKAAGESTSSSAPLGEALRDLGGFSVVLHAARRHVMDEVRANPRMRDQVAGLELELSRRMPVMQAAVRQALSALGSFGVTVHHPPKDDHSDRLGIGLHGEVRLAPDSVPWMGFADAIRITADGCEIIDYKTGATSIDHEDQIRLYAALWRFDSHLNPLGTPAIGLRLIYADREVVVPPPNADDLETRAQELTAQYHNVRDLLTHLPPVAKPSPDVCNQCDVRQLCPEFWSAIEAGGVWSGSDYRSVELVTKRRRANGVWDVVVERDATLPAGTEAVLVDNHGRSIELGSRLRILGARIDQLEDSLDHAITLLPWSEVFAITPMSEAN